MDNMPPRTYTTPSSPMNRTCPIAQVTMLDSNPAFYREGCSEENRAFLLFSIYLMSLFCIPVLG